MADISKITLGSTTYNVKDATARAGVMPFGVTAGGTTAYTVSLTGVTLSPGTLIACKFNATNAANATLNVNSLGAVPIYYKGSAITASQITANYVVLLIYEKSTVSTGCWHEIWSYGYNTNTNTVPTGYCDTAAATSAKTATCTGYLASSDTYLPIIFTKNNSAKTKLTLNVNSQGAKTIYINGNITSESNYFIPAGTYIAYFDGTNYQIRTDGKIPGSISGDAQTLRGKTPSDIAQLVYPVGSVYISTEERGPLDLGIGGTWQEIKLNITWSGLETGNLSYANGTSTGNLHFWRRTA